MVSLDLEWLKDFIIQIVKDFWKRKNIENHIDIKSSKEETYLEIFEA